MAEACVELARPPDVSRPVPASLSPVPARAQHGAFCPAPHPGRYNRGCIAPSLCAAPSPLPLDVEPHTLRPPATHPRSGAAGAQADQVFDAIEQSQHEVLGPASNIIAALEAAAYVLCHYETATALHTYDIRRRFHFVDTRF